MKYVKLIGRDSDTTLSYSRITERLRHDLAKRLKGDKLHICLICQKEGAFSLYARI